MVFTATGLRTQNVAAEAVAEALGGAGGTTKMGGDTTTMATGCLRMAEVAEGSGAAAGVNIKMAGVAAELLPTGRCKVPILASET